MKQKLGMQHRRGRPIPELRSPTRSLCASPLANKGHHRRKGITADIASTEASGWHGACPYSGKSLCQQDIRNLRNLNINNSGNG